MLLQTMSKMSTDHYQHAIAKALSSAILEHNDHGCKIKSSALFPLLSTALCTGDAVMLLLNVRCVQKEKFNMSYVTPFVRCNVHILTFLKCYGNCILQGRMAIA